MAITDDERTPLLENGAKDPSAADAPANLSRSRVIAILGATWAS